MTDPYSISLLAISLDEYERTLAAAALLPGRVMLRENLGRHFDALRTAGIRNLGELSAGISTEVKRKVLSARTGIDESWLTLLRREINGFIPKPVALSSFPGIDPEVVAHLNRIGIATSKDLFMHALTRADRQALAESSGAPYDAIRTLTCLSDLARVNGVGPVFAVMIYETGCETIGALSRANAHSLFEALTTLNQRVRHTRAAFTVKDIAHCIAFAQKLPDSIRHDA